MEYIDRSKFLITKVKELEAIANDVSNDAFFSMLPNETCDDMIEGPFFHINDLADSRMETFIYLTLTYNRCLKKDSLNTDDLKSIILLAGHEFDIIKEYPKFELSEYEMSANSKADLDSVEEHKNICKALLNKNNQFGIYEIGFLGKTKEIVKEHYFKIQYLNSKFAVMQLYELDSIIEGSLDRVNRRYEEFEKDSKNLDSNKKKLLKQTKESIEIIGQLLLEKINYSKKYMNKARCLKYLLEEMEELANLLKVELKANPNDVMRITYIQEIIMNYELAGQPLPEELHSYLIDMGFGKEVEEDIKRFEYLYGESDSL